MDKKKILIADSDEKASFKLKQILEKAGYEVFIASTLQQALEIFHNEKPNLCILDVFLPEPCTAGLALLNQIKQADKTTVCIILTNLDDDIRRQTAEEFGAVAYYTRPVDKEDILTTVEVSLRTQSRIRSGKTREDVLPCA